MAKRTMKKEQYRNLINEIEQQIGFFDEANIRPYNPLDENNSKWAAGAHAGHIARVELKKQLIAAFGEPDENKRTGITEEELGKVFQAAHSEAIQEIKKVMDEKSLPHVLNEMTYENVAEGWRNVAFSEPRSARNILEY